MEYLITIFNPVTRNVVEEYYDLYKFNNKNWKFSN